MRPLYLRLERFLGLERVELEFPSNLFVIVGPNGAGKSSLLEAMYFALYGRGIRTERGKKELIHRGSPDKALRVQLEFLLGERKFRVTREYSVKQGGTAYLEQREGERWKPVASGEQGVTAYIEELLGCDALTFRSSVFLPQGETLAFVEASSADRFRTLSSLFGLDVLDRMRELVRDRVKILEGELGPLREKLRLLETEDLEGEATRLREEEATLERELRLAGEKSRALEKRLEGVKRLREVLRELRERAERIASLERRRVELLRLAEEDEAIELAHRIHETLEESWRSVAGFLARVAQEEEQEKERLQRTEEDLVGTKRSLIELLAEEERWKRAKEELSSCIQEVEEAGVPLFEELRKGEGELALWEDKEKELRARIAEFSTEEERLKKEEAKRQKILNEKETLLAEAEEAYAKAEEAQRVLDELLPEDQKKAQEFERLKGEWQRLLGEIAKYDERMARLLGEKQRIEARLKVLEEEKEAHESRYRHGVRAFVVGELEEEWRRQGACPVCGSRVPFPEGERERVDIVALEREYRGFQEEWVALSSRKEHLEQEIQEVSQEKKERGAELEEIQRKAGVLSAERQKLRDEIRKTLVSSGYPERESFSFSRFREWVRSKGKARESLQKEVEMQRRELVALQERFLFLKERKEEETKRLSEVCAAKEKILQELAPKRERFAKYCVSLGISGDTFPQYLEGLKDKLRRAEQEVARLEAEVKTKKERIDFLGLEIKRLVEALRQKKEEKEALAREEYRLRELFLAELEKRQWSEETYRKLLERKPGTSRMELHRLEGELEGLKREKLEREREKGELEKILGLSGDAAETEFQRLQRELEELRNKAGFLNKRLGEIREGLRQNERKRREWQELRATVGEKSRVYEVHTKLQQALEVGGFKNYLLRILFTRLEEESSKILLGLSGGRYALRMQMRRGMADIAVLDRRFGGGERLPEECSGGEKTLIALALALALSSLRLEEKYARRTECLFIDEGFSTLDREHLDLVADAIFRLSREGKMVGIVTHDPDFAGYFPVQLEVREGTVQWKRSESPVI